MILLCTQKIQFFFSFLSSFLLLSARMSAQIAIHGELPPLGLIDKTVYDTAYVKVYYEYSFRPDSMNMKRKDGQTLLLIGDNCTGFCDYFSNRSDFINDSLYYAKRPPMELFTLCMGFFGKKNYDMPLVIDKERKEATVQIMNINEYQYQQSVPDIKWQLVEGDTTLADVPCKKATCSFGGREWTVWYAPSFSISAGPYLFGGLPGLIFDIRDTKDNYHFSLNGLEHLKQGAPIYLRKDSRMLKTTREKARKAVQNEQKNIYKVMQMQHPNDRFENVDSGDTGKRPYNPIELE